MRNLNHRWPQSGHFSPKLGHLFPISEKRTGETSTPTPDVNVGHSDQLDLFENLFRFSWKWKLCRWRNFSKNYFSAFFWGGVAVGGGGRRGINLRCFERFLGLLELSKRNNNNNKIVCGIVCEVIRLFVN